MSLSLHRTSLVLLAASLVLLCFASTGAYAQLSGIPSCASDCVDPSAKAIQCTGASDMKCICQDTNDFIQQMQTCTQNTCTGPDFSDFIAALTNDCLDVLSTTIGPPTGNGTTTSKGGTGTGTGSTTRTSTGTSSGTGTTSSPTTTSGSSSTITSPSTSGTSSTSASQNTSTTTTAGNAGVEMKTKFELGVGIGVAVVLATAIFFA